MEDNELDTYNKAISTFGVLSQLDMLCEECAELIHCINKYKRGRANSKNLINELVDVEITLSQAKLIIKDENLFSKIKASKIARLNRIIEKDLERQVNIGKGIPKLEKELGKSNDFFKAIASQIFNISSTEISKEQRNLAKSRVMKILIEKITLEEMNEFNKDVDGYGR